MNETSTTQAISLSPKIILELSRVYLNCCSVSELPGPDLPLGKYGGHVVLKPIHASGPPVLFLGTKLMCLGQREPQVLGEPHL